MKKYCLTIFCLTVLHCAFSQVVHIDSKMTGRTFEGVGALSAGASSRLLIDYPEPQRSQILDYLFKPQFGASLHHLKVEIGGDVNSTCGTEPSHMHHRGDEDYTCGYEWWLMKEAKARYPSIMLDALAWGAPYWIGNGTYYSDENAEYMAKFVKGAKEVHGLNIDYIGCWNETAYNVNWIKTLRKTLNKYNLPVKIVAADEVHSWNIVNDMKLDEELYRAVDVVGNHYNQGMNILPLPNSGLMVANTPWSGHYELSPALWAMAHVGQFTQPGWTFLEGNANGYTQVGASYVSLMSPDKKDVSIVIETTEARSGQNLLLAIDPLWREKQFHIWKTDSANHFLKEQTVTATNGYLELKLLPGAIYTLSTTTGQQKGIPLEIPARQKFPIPYSDDFDSYPPNRLPRYTIDQAGVFETVTSGGRKILRQQIPQIGIEWPIHINPEPYTILGDNDMDDYSISMDVQLTKPNQCVDLMGRIKQVYQWEVVRPRGYWLRISSNGVYELCKSIDALTSWQRWKKEDWPEVVKQMQGDTRNFVKIPIERLSDADYQRLSGHLQEVTDKKNSEVIFNKNGTYSIHTKIILASGKCTFPLKKWNQVKLSFKGSRILADLNGKNLCSVEDDMFPSGLAGFGCSRHTADFDNLKIEK